MDEKEKLPTGGKRLKRNRRGLLIAALCVFGALIIGFGAVCFAASSSTAILRGVRLFGIDFGGMTVEQAARELEADIVQGDCAGARFCVDEGHEVFKSYAQLGMTLDCEQSAQALYAYGREGNLLQNGWQYIFARGAEIKPVWNIDEAHMKKTAHEIANELTYAPVDFSCAADETGLYAIKPCNGQTFPADEVIEACETQLCSGEELSYVIETQTPAQEPQKSDYPALLEQVRKEFAEPCVNAGYDKETDSILSEKVHAEFNLDDAIAKMDAASGGETVCITQNVEYPKVTAAELKQVLFRDVLGTYTTKVGGAPGRHKNVQLTASRIDGFVMNSGESIKYGELTTPFTLENGYFLAPMYLKGKTVDGAGGGACQASSTLYAASILANLEIVQRINHGFASDYIGLGLDATVAEGGPEFEVRNNTDYPIKVQAIFETRKGKDYITVNLLGTKTDGTYVKIRTEVLSTTPYEEEIVETDELAPGAREVEQTPYTGYLVKTYRQVYSGDGKLISETFEATSKYNARNRIIKVGKSAESVSGEVPITEGDVDPTVIDWPTNQPPTMEPPIEETETPGWLMN
ncbi:MAG: VanW family protein [Eubacteriales bacterium]|nr:VanW family protein [Eubacteriales bacterium]